MNAGADLPDSSWLTSDGRVRDDMGCVDCGYNLRALSPGAACPECGRAVLRSLPLRFKPLPWLRRLYLGVGLTLLAFVLFQVVAQLQSVFTGIFPRAVGQRVEPSAVWFFVVCVLPAIVSTLWFSGMLLFATREGFADRPRAVSTIRSGVPLAIVAAWVASLYSASLDPEDHLVHLVASLLAAVFTAAIVLAWLSLARELAKRDSRRMLRSLIRVVAIGCLPGLIGMIGFQSLKLAMAVSAPAPALPYAIEEFSNAPAREYIVFDESGAMVRTTTVPAALLIPPPSRPPWLEKLYADLMTETHFSLFVAASWAAAIGEAVVALAVFMIVRRAINEKHRQDRLASPMPSALA